MDSLPFGSFVRLGNNNDCLKYACKLIIKLNNFWYNYCQHWNDGITAGSTSAAWMLLVMKLITEPNKKLWSQKAIGDVSLLLMNDSKANVER